MSDLYSELSPKLMDFIQRQQIFFTGSAAATGKVNISPRPTDTLRVIGPNGACYLDYIGSGNETAAHLLQVNRMTMMFCAVAGPPMILRLYGSGATHAKDTPEYAALLDKHYDGQAPRNARQIVQINIDAVQTSCGYGVPLFEYQGERQSLTNWADAKSDQELVDYQQVNSRFSLDGFETGHPTLNPEEAGS